MELRVNTESKVWRYDYVIDEKYEKMNWYKDEFETAEELMAQWVLLNRDCRALLYTIASSSANDNEIDDVINDSWIAFDELRSEGYFEQSLTKDELKSRYFNTVKKQSVKNNNFGANCSSKTMVESATRRKADHKYLETVKNDEKIEKTLPFKGMEWNAIELVTTKEELDLLLRHYNLGKAESLTLTGATRGAYNIKMDRLIKRVRRRIEAVDKYN